MPRPGRMSPAEREEAKIWAERYQCPHCFASPDVGHYYVTVAHARTCPRFHRTPARKKYHARPARPLLRSVR